MHIKIHTNIQKSQFRDLGDGTLQILGIPITVDDAVMNGIYYGADDNAKGLVSYRDQPITLRHPEDENGNGVSALSGVGLMNHWAGGIVINTYNADGINYADAEFKEKIMLAHKDGEYYVNRIKEGLPIGISTGLFFDGNNESGVSGCGKEYHAVARNQQGDHVAMLPDEEAPAGGAATFIRFNGKNDDQEITINIDEMILAINSEAVELIDSVASNDDEKSLLARFFSLCKQKFASNKAPCDNDDEITTNEEGDAMRETVENQLKAKGIAFNATDTDDQLLALLSKPAEVKDQTKTINTAIAAALKLGLAPLAETVKKLQDDLQFNTDKELDVLAKKAAPFMGLEADDARQLGANALHKVLAKNGVTIGVDSGTNHKSPEGNKDTSGITMEPWNEGAK